MIKYVLLFAVAVSLGGHAHSEEAYVPGQAPKGNFKNYAYGILDKYCIDCHDGEHPKTDVSFYGLGPVNEVNAAMWKSIWAQVSLQEMPPKKKKNQPGIIERLEFTDWILNELQLTMKDKGGFTAHLDPKKGNFLDHKLLFGEMPEGIQLLPTSSPARIWRITPQEHITRLNELINTEPEFNPKGKGLRTHGDAVGDTLYFGVDRLIRFKGGPAYYTRSVKQYPVVLSSGRTHGLENYAHFYSVNSAEATQILSQADSILRYMAYGPLSVAKPEQITDDPKTYTFDRGLLETPAGLVYSTKVVRPLTPVYELMKEEGLSSEGVRKSVDFVFEAVTFRPPSGLESDSHVQIVMDSVAKLGKEDGVFMGLSSIFVHRNALFRSELVEQGKADAHGRVMMQDWELGLAVNHALRYLKPDEQLRKAIVEGRMRTREDVAREVTRMLADERIRKPRVLRFFRDYFDYDLGGNICKDIPALRATGAIVSKNAGQHYKAMFGATASTDRLIERILEEDKEVLKELLTTQKALVAKRDDVYFGHERTPSEMEEARRVLEKNGEAKLALKTTQVAKQRELVKAAEAALAANPEDRQLSSRLLKQKKELENAERNFALAKKRMSQSFIPELVAKAKLRRVGPEKVKVGPELFDNQKHGLKPGRTVVSLPKDERLGLLTHPSWLVSHTDAMDNHAIHRGIWVRERLLGGGIPDVPITVDAQLPDEPENTLRERMRVTRETYCWSCHEKMDPLGLPFEMYNHAGIYRSFEKGKPVDTSGEIIDSGDPSLDGPVKNAIEMIEKLANSERAEQVFVRHAFRFWMGRNETLHDAPVLQAAHKAYRDNDGSMNALLTSLVTSDAFLYRTVQD